MKGKKVTNNYLDNKRGKIEVNLRKV